MPIEAFGFINSLNSSNPAASDGVLRGDDHLRGIKSTLLASFPTINGPLTTSLARLNAVGLGTPTAADGNAFLPSITFTNDTSKGFYNAGPGVTGIVGKLQGDGAIPTGMIADFLNIDIPPGWYELNGQAVSRTGATAALFAKYGTSFGSGDGSTTFNLPNLTDRYRRSRGTWGASVMLADAIKSHTSPVSVSGANHSHPGSSATNGAIDIELPTGRNGQATGFTVGTGQLWYGSTGFVNHAPAISLNIANSGSLSMTGTATYSGDVETRPLSVVVVTCVKA